MDTDEAGGSCAGGQYAHHSKEPIPSDGTPSDVVDSKPIFTDALGMRETRSAARSRNPSDVLQNGRWCGAGQATGGARSHCPGSGSPGHHVWPGWFGHG
jgi:hypothetical protein